MASDHFSTRDPTAGVNRISNASLKNFRSFIAKQLFLPAFGEET